jgi:hypothetical protein
MRAGKRLDIVVTPPAVDAAPRQPAEKRERARMRVEHRLLRLARSGLDIGLCEYACSTYRLESSNLRDF